MIPRSRRISVDGLEYRWSLPARSPRYRWDEPGPARNCAVLTVQEDVPRPGRVAQSMLRWTNGKPVTPEAVAQVIRRMLAAGWDPASRGAAFKVEDVDVGTLDVAYVREAIVREVMES